MRAAVQRYRRPRNHRFGHLALSTVKGKPCRSMGCVSEDALMKRQRTTSPRAYVSRSVAGHHRPLMVATEKASLGLRRDVGR